MGSNDLQLYLKLCVEFLQKYKFLLEFYITDFFTDDLWNLLPENWQCIFNNLLPSDLANDLIIISDEVKENQKYRCNSVWPLSLLAFKKCTAIYSIPREKTLFNANVKFKNKSSEGARQQQKFVFQKHVGTKKRHEIQALSQVIEKLYKEEDCSTVVDVGSGQGHLSRMLGFGYNLPLVALEHEEELIKMAKKFDAEAKLNFANCRCSHSISNFPTHRKCTILPDITHDSFAQIIANSENDPALLPRNDRYLLTGLHACGDLSPTMIRLFQESSSVRALVSVACCYIKLTTDSDDPGKDFRSEVCVRSRICYPMSCFVKSLKGHELSYKSLKLACHGIEAFRLRLKNNDPRLKIQCYRAVLEVLIRKLHPGTVRPAVKTIKNAHLLPFEEYAKKAFNRVNLVFPEGQDVINDEISGMLKEWNKVIVLFTLAQMLGPVVETVILLDRLIYLEENGIKSEIVPIFDPLLSPRCFALIAKKG